MHMTAIALARGVVAAAAGSVEAVFPTVIGMLLLLNDIQQHGGSKRMYFFVEASYMSLNATPFYCTYLINDPLAGPAHGQGPGEGVTAHAAEATAATGEWFCVSKGPLQVDSKGQTIF